MNDTEELFNRAFMAGMKRGKGESNDLDERINYKGNIETAQGGGHLRSLKEKQHRNNMSPFVDKNLDQIANKDFAYEESPKKMVHSGEEDVYIDGSRLMDRYGNGKGLDRFTDGVRGGSWETYDVNRPKSKTIQAEKEAAMELFGIPTYAGNKTIPIQDKWWLSKNYGVYTLQELDSLYKKMKNEAVPYNDDTAKLANIFRTYGMDPESLNWDYSDFYEKYGLTEEDLNKNE